MTTRNLDALFEPRAIALIGASNQPGSVGQVIAANLQESGFSGPVLPVNPAGGAIRSTLAYTSIAELPVTPDLAVIATPAPTVPGLISELGARGCRAAVVISAGFGDPAARQALLDASRPHLLRIIGPNCLGILSPPMGINASFAQLTPAAGGLALVAQSGAVTTAALDWACAKGFGFSHVVTLGDMADVDFGDMLDYLALDDATKAILLYVESVNDARKFMTAGRIAARAKPVVVIKTGRSAAGAKAAFSHTGALAGADAVYDAAFRRAGMLRVGQLRELFDAVTTLSSGLKVRGDRLAVLTNGGGAGVLAIDALEALGARPAVLQPETLEALDQVLPATWSRGNPVDIIGDAPPERYGAALEKLLADPGADAVLVLNCPTAVADGEAAARQVVQTLRATRSRRPVLTSWLGEVSQVEARRLFAQAHIPSHETPDEAVRAFTHLVQYERNQAQLMETPPAWPQPEDRDAARRVIEDAIADGRTRLSDPEAKAVLKAYGIPVAESLIAATPQEAAERASELPPPYALKILSPDITHKTDVGGVALGLSSPEAVAEAARKMNERVAAAAPNARLAGFVVQPMIVRPRARELIAGLAVDPTFGPVVLFGQGGVAVEVLADRVVGLPPLNRVLALEMISRTRVSALLGAYRDRPAADAEGVAEVLERLSLMAVELPQLAELDINPLLADEHGVIALDARISLTSERKRMAIRPYPGELAGPLPLPGAGSVWMRPIRPDDEPALVEMVERTSKEDMRLRVHGPVKRLPHVWAARLSQIDYDREMALVAEDPPGELIGVARLIADPEGRSGEFALLVRTDRQHRGIGRALMARLLEHAAARGLSEVWGDVLAENRRMLALVRELGFTRAPSGDLSVVKVVKALGES